MSTITAISTPLGSGGISIVRMSGEKALDIAFSLFISKNLTKSNIEPRKLYLGTFNSSEIKEKCLMVYFKAPFSYTGEDLIEFQCHGGRLITEKILNILLENGAVMAENGEFTKRAFMNGKMSLDAVEGVADIINATSEAELKAGYNLMSGELYKKVTAFQNELTDLLARVEVMLDYPEHDEEQITLKEVNKSLITLQNKVEELLLTAKNGRLIKDGINAIIVGKPNVGKSSLLNLLLGEDRAIVTEIAGTTRDIVRESIVYKGQKINFLDTAGLHESNDYVENIGIEKSKDTIKLADIILFVVDAESGITKEDKQILELLKNKNYLTIYNKTDLNNNYKCEKNTLYISAISGKGAEKIKDAIIDNMLDKNIPTDALILTNARHIEALKESQTHINNAIQSISLNKSDIVALELKLIWNSLGKITGETENQTIVDRIFEKYCLGK